MKQTFKTLRPSTKRWINSIKRRYELEDFHERLLVLAGQAWDRATEAREFLAEDGAVIVDRFEQKKPHPAVQIESQAMLNFAKLLREIGLDLDRSEPSRPPRQY